VADLVKEIEIDESKYKSRSSNMASDGAKPPKGLNSLKTELYRRLDRQSRQWAASGLPSRQALLTRAAQLAQWKQQQGVPGLWTEKPLLLTATLDDGMGVGLDMIHRYADVLGLTLMPLGLLQAPAVIVDACQRYRPDFLGVTVLQPDSGDDLAFLGKHLPARTRLIAGGPAFRYDPELARRCGVHFVARDVGAFIAFMLQNVCKERSGT
jgi:hypothetical protein